MKKLMALMLALIMLTAAAAAETAETETPRIVGQIKVTPMDEPVSDRLAGIKVGIDPGHQEHQNSAKERVSPYTSETKMKVSSGTQGVKTRIPEYQTNLVVGLMLRDALEALGCEVYMTREVNEIDISNQERAFLMNGYGVDIVLRIHCNGADSSSLNGIGLYVNKTGPIAESSYEAAEALMDAMLEATGARKDGIFRRDTYTMNNWSEMPCILVEMGYMSNPEEDVKLNDPDYQAKLVSGMVEGICAYFGR